MEGITKYYDGEPAPNEHTENHCDRCGALVGKKHLKAVSFLYMDKNDKNHIDMSPTIRAEKRKHLLKETGGDLLLTEMLMAKFYVEPGYRQYYICESCSLIENAIQGPSKKKRVH